MMAPEDGLPRSGHGFMKAVLRFVSQSSGQVEFNPFVIEPEEVLLYGYLYSVERESSAEPEGPLTILAKDLTAFPHLKPPPEETPIDEDEDLVVDEDAEPPKLDDLRLDDNPEEDLITLCFDCVDAGYFNKNLDPFRAFYGQVRGENIDTDARDLTKAYWHDEAQAQTHLALLDAFHDGTGPFDPSTAKLVKTPFIKLYLTFPATSANMAVYEALVGGEGWIGLGVMFMTAPGLPLAAYVSGSDESEGPSGAVLRTVYDLTAWRRQLLQYVFSLDFASDAHFEPDPSPPLPVPLPVRVPPLDGGIKKKRWRRPPTKTKKDRSKGGMIMFVDIVVVIPNRGIRNERVSIHGGNIVFSDDGMNRRSKLILKRHLQQSRSTRLKTY